MQKLRKVFRGIHIDRYLNTFFLFASLCFHISSNAQTLYDVWDSSNPSNYIFVGTIETVTTPDSAHVYYDYYSFSGHPTCVNLGSFRANTWLHLNSTTGELSLAMIYGNFGISSPINEPTILLRIVDSDTDPYLSVQDDPSSPFNPVEIEETPPGSNAFKGTFKYRGNTDGMMISDISGSSWTIIITPTDFGNVTEWDMTYGSCNYSDDLHLNLTSEYRITPQENPPSDLPVVPGDLIADAGIDQNGCAGDVVTLGGSPCAVDGTPPYSYSWTPTTGLDYADVANPNLTINGVDLYQLEITDSSVPPLTAMDQVAISDADISPPICLTKDITISLDSNGVATIVPLDVDNGSADNCGISSMSLNQTQFECMLQDYPIELTVSDASGNTCMGICTVSTESTDTDCDGVCDSCDECEGGDDTIDNNNDNLPDCAYPPDFSDIIGSWKCGINDVKVLVCHVPPGDPDNRITNCVGPNSIDFHMDHGDYLGPCQQVSCSSNEIITTHLNQYDSGDLFEVFPNPGTGYFKLKSEQPLNEEVNVYLFDLAGHLHLQKTIIFNGDDKVDLTEQGVYFPQGIYLLKLVRENSIEIVRVYVVE